MNALKRKIEKGEIVVIRADYLKPEYAARDERLFECRSGFGMSNATVGGKIFGVYLIDGESSCIYGDAIDKAETEAYQAEQAKNKETNGSDV